MFISTPVIEGINPLAHKSNLYQKSIPIKS